jgi:hypothetical protein
MICHDTTRGVGRFLRAIKKNGLAANNGDTLGEAVISAKTKNSDQDNKEKFDLRQQLENRIASSSTIFSSDVLKDANQ